ncbi:MAG TPA: hypothetical protein VNO30_41400 [Kofleriaceae bacterium]|nr:hypothetical protein [Kofleriaceae bacterium]
MRSPWLLLLAVASCHRAPAAPRIEGRASADVHADAAPRLTWNEQDVYNQFDAPRLPAVSASGAAILLGIRDMDGNRGNANYRFEIRNRRDAKIAGYTVLSIEEGGTIFEPDGGTRELERRIAVANHWLEEQHGVKRFAPLTKITPVDQLAFRATGGGITVDWVPSRLKIAHAGKTLLERTTPATWLVKGEPMMAGISCPVLARLADASVSLAHKVALLEISYYGTNQCWPTNSQHHVVTW